MMLEVQCMLVTLDYGNKITAIRGNSEYSAIDNTLHMLCILQVWNPLGIVGVITAFNFPCAVLGEVFAFSIDGLIHRSYESFIYDATCYQNRVV